MTGRFWFDWPLLALSLANGILLLWLGLTVLLNAERRTPGVALLALAAWLGSAFFAAHTAILASGEGPASAALNLWWEVGWLPLLALPLAWYGVVLWYSGYGGEARGLRRHRLPLALTVITFGGLTAAFFASAGLPSFLDAVNLRFGTTATLFGAPWFLVLYPAYILVCVALSFDALLRPAPAPSRQSTAARLRARPWLLTANTLLVVVGGLVAVLLIWVARTPGPTATNELFSATLLPLDPWTATTAGARHLALAIAWTDLLVSALLAVVIVCMSYALVQYEVFSGRALPRRALRRHWRTALLLAVGYGVVVGATLAAGWRPAYSLLLTALLMTFFFALLGWRTFAAQSDFVRRLQPFVVSTHLAEELIAPAAPAAATAQDAAATFAALCREVLHTEYAALAATGALAALVDSPLVYPAEAPPPGVLPPLPAPSDDLLAVAIDAPGLPQVAWALPIQGPQGPVGVMLLGRRRGDDLYAEEEIAIARATGERLLDLLAAAALARRLLDLTREQWAEGQVADRQTRRVLHDEVLPDLHAALIMLGQGGDAQIALARDLLATAHRQTAALLRDLPARPPVRPSGHLLADLRRLVEEEMASRFDTVHFAADGAATVTAARLRPLHAEVVFYAVRELARNAARHGHGATAPFTLTVTATGGSELAIVVCDNGQSAPAAGGAGQGLALHTAMLAVVGGGITLTQMPAGGSQAVLRIATAPTAC